VRNRDQAAARCNRRGLLPQRRQLDAVDAVAPCIPLDEPRLVQTIGELELVELAAADAAHLVEVGLDVAQHIFRKNAPEIVAKELVVAILVAELRRRLREELVHWPLAKRMSANLYAKRRHGKRGRQSTDRSALYPQNAEVGAGVIFRDRRSACTKRRASGRKRLLVRVQKPPLEQHMAGEPLRRHQRRRHAAKQRPRQDRTWIEAR